MKIDVFRGMKRQRQVSEHRDKHISLLLHPPDRVLSFPSNKEAEIPDF